MKIYIKNGLEIISHILSHSAKANIIIITIINHYYFLTKLTSFNVVFGLITANAAQKHLCWWICSVPYPCSMIYRWLYCELWLLIQEVVLFSQAECYLANQITSKHKCRHELRFIIMLFLVFLFWVFWAHCLEVRSFHGR